MIDFLIKIFIKDYKNTEDNGVREKYGVLTGALGIVLNGLLFGLKLFVGLISGSIAAMADAFNNLTDAGSSVISMVGFKLANKPVDKDHPFGHGRMEYLAGLLVSIIIILVGAELAMSSVEKIITPTQTNMTDISLIILAVAILIKMFMFGYNMQVAKRIKSASIKATAMDCITDAIATLVVLISGVIARFTHLYIDGYVGGLVALFIIFAGIRSAKETIDDLLGKAPDKSVLTDITEFVMSYDTVVGVHDLIVHNYGVGRELISLHAEVPCTENINYIHEQIDKIEMDIYNKFKMQAVIHMDPVEVDNQTVISAKHVVSQVVKEIFPECTIHDFRMVKGENRTNLIFDVVVPHEYKLSPSEVADKIGDSVSKVNPKYKCVIKIDRPYV